MLYRLFGTISKYRDSLWNQQRLCATFHQVWLIFATCTLITNTCSHTNRYIKSKRDFESSLGRYKQMHKTFLGKSIDSRGFISNIKGLKSIRQTADGL